MYDLAKKGREALKKKARRLAGEKYQKVDSSDWSPPEQLNANVKTGMRPISRRAYKSGGKVEGECAPMNAGKKPRKSGGSVKEEASEWMKAKINRDVKKANDEREGEKHVGGLKTGGRAAKQDGGDVGQLNRMVPSEMRRKIEDGTKTPTQMPKNPPLPPKRPAEVVGAPGTKPVMDDDQIGRLERGYKKGGKAKKAGGGYVPHNTKAGKPEIPGMKKGGRTKKMGGGATAGIMGGLLPGLVAGLGKKDAEERKSGGRTERKSGGRVGKGKTNINIVIATKPMDGQSDVAGPSSMRAPAGMRPPGGVPVLMPMPGMGAGPMPMPPGGGLPMPPGGAPMGGPPMPLARKRGGRTYKTYKDMDAGAGSGVGRLEKTEIASRK